jgi:hypothetical protein
MEDGGGSRPVSPFLVLTVCVVVAGEGRIVKRVRRLLETQIDPRCVGVVCRPRDQDFQQELAALVEGDREGHSVQLRSHFLRMKKHFAVGVADAKAHG